MSTHEKMSVVLAILILSVAIVYFVVAWQAVLEMGDQSTSNGIMGSKLEVTLFSIVGFGYLTIFFWIIKQKLHTPIPYIITSVGSTFMIGMYLVAITIGVPVLGIETEADPIAAIAKILQGTIIGMSIFLIPFTLKTQMRGIVTK